VQHEAGPGPCAPDVSLGQEENPSIELDAHDMLAAVLAILRDPDPRLVVGRAVRAGTLNPERRTCRRDSASSATVIGRPPALIAS
jgi:hypothetical protein